jgi:superfamily II DNA helicase RecQ
LGAKHQKILKIHIFDIHLGMFNVKILTLPFDEVTESFPDEIVQEFCANKVVKEVKANFFEQKGKIFWSIYICYEKVPVPTKKEKLQTRTLSDAEKVLFDKLKAWRKATAEKHGFPPYIIATNNELTEIIEKNCQTLACLKTVKGFGKKKIESYGQLIIEQIKSFREANTVTTGQN